MKSRILSVVLAMALSTTVHATDGPSQAQTQKGGLAGLFGQAPKSKFLPVHQAFGVSVSQDGDKLKVAFDVTTGHYVYQDKLAVKLPDGVSAGAWQFDRTPTYVDDPTFGRVAVFEENVVATTTLTSSRPINDAPITIRWQGCAKAGLCYPPENLPSVITLPPKSASSPKSTPKSELHAAPKIEPSDDNLISSQTPQAPTDITPSNQAMSKPSTPIAPSDEMSTSTNVAVSEPNLTSDLTVEQGEGGIFSQNPATLPTTSPSGQNPTDSTATPTNPTISHTIPNQDPFGINERPFVAVGLLFMLGLLLALTPCVYPMIPIVANIVAKSNATRASQGFWLSAGYGLGVATAYGVLGMIIAWFGQALGIIGYLQNPYILGGFAVLFLVLALAMFDVIRLRLPSFITQTLQQKSQSADKYLGSVWGSFLVGLLSALVVSPCVSLPMAGALSAVATTQNVGLGFIMLFMLGLGLSIPLVIMGAMQGKFMPKSGAWTQYVKEFCALLLLAVAVSLAERIWVSPAVLVLWAVWFAILVVWLYRLKVLFARALALVAVAWVGCLMVGASMGNSDPWRPVGMTAQKTHSDLTITTLAELDEILGKHDKVLVDVTATWCVECRIMERTLFTNRPAEMSDYQVVKLDITNTTDDSRAVLARYELFGPPALIIYRKGELKHLLLGETKRADLIQALTF